jgi:A/G-specific adenine glycosylase
VQVPIDDVAATGFEAGAAAYELARPGYPDEAVAVLVGMLGIAAGVQVLDLAAGTGKLTRRLIELGASVIAIEPVRGMRRELQQAVAGVEVLDGTAESIPLADASVDVVTVAQAFHWFDAPLALAEIARVLRPGGGLAILWNERDESTPWVAEMSRIIRWHERTVSRYQRVGAVHAAPRAGHGLGAAAHPRAAGRSRAVDQLHRRDAGAGAGAPRGRRGGPRQPSPGAVPAAVSLSGPVGAPRVAAVLAWWDVHARDLPWRRTRDPWAVLVCEVMAQQTQVARVAERWGPFLERFPDPAAMAAAPVGDALRLWSGLGYPRRALALHRCAQAVVERHGGRLPSGLTDLLALPGIGPYTARAVSVFAFELDHGVVDTNTARVLARWSGRRLGPRDVQEVADGEVPAGRGWAWNQALLDLGATVCTKRAPRCDACPVTDSCAWFAAGLAAPDPARGTAGVSRGQGRFEGSDRQGRGRLMAALGAGPVRAADLPTAMGWPDEPQRAERVAGTLVADGLAERSGARYRLRS